MDNQAKLFVESKWKNIGVYGYGGQTEYVNLADISQEFYNTINEPNCHWESAARFTRDRLEQIKDVEEEINLLKKIRVSKDWYAAEWVKLNRIIDREEVLVFNLEKGMIQ